MVAYLLRLGILELIPLTVHTCKKKHARAALSVCAVQMHDEQRGEAEHLTLGLKACEAVL